MQEGACSSLPLPLSQLPSPCRSPPSPAWTQTHGGLRPSLNLLVTNFSEMQTEGGTPQLPITTNGQNGSPEFHPGHSRAGLRQPEPSQLDPSRLWKAGCQQPKLGAGNSSQVSHWRQDPQPLCSSEHAHFRGFTGPSERPRRSHRCRRKADEL